MLSVHAESRRGQSSPPGGTIKSSSTAVKHQVPQETDRSLSALSSSKVTNLPNHLTVATTERQSPAVGLVWKLPAGSKYEGPEMAGFSHLLRHALFFVPILTCSGLKLNPSFMVSV